MSAGKPNQPASLPAFTFARRRDLRFPGLEILAGLPNKNALHQRAYRQRQKRGVAMIRVPVDVETIAALIDAGRIDEHSALDASRVGSAIGDVMRAWAKLWAEK